MRRSLLVTGDAGFLGQALLSRLLTVEIRPITDVMHCKGVVLPASLVALENLVDFIVLCADLERSPWAVNEAFLFLMVMMFLRQNSCAR